MKNIIYRITLMGYLILFSNTIYATNDIDKQLEANYPSSYNRHTAHQFNNDALGALQMYYMLNNNEYILNTQEQIGQNDIPVIYIEPDLTFYLIYKGEELQYHAQESTYLNLMAIHNTPISTYIIVTQTNDQALKISRLQLLAKLITNVNQELNASHLKPEEINNAHKLLNTNLKYINQFIKSSTISNNELNQFTKAMKPLMTNTMKDAIHYKMERLNQVINTIQAKTAKDTPNTMIIFRGNPFHRQNSVVKLVLEYKYKFKADKNLMSDENSHIIYADYMHMGYDSSIEGLATVMLDQQYADQFYGNINAMRSDQANKYAKEYLPKLK